MKKKTKRILATAMAGVSLFGLVGCGPKTNKNDVAEDNSKYETQLQGQQQKLDEQQQKMAEQQQLLEGLQSQLQSMQAELKAAQADINGLKEADKKLEKLINSNMATVTESYNSLLKQVNDLANDHAALESAIAGDVSSLQARYTALNTQMQSVSDALTNLQTAVETLQQGSNTESLVANLQQMQSKVNQLIVQNALNLTLNTRYNSINCYAGGNNFDVETNPNGEYVISSNNYYSVVKNGIVFENNNGEESAKFEGKPFISKVTSLVYPANSVVTNSGSTYTVTHTNSVDRVTIDLDSNGYVAGFNCFNTAIGNVDVRETREIDSSLYQSQYTFAASNIDMIKHYDTVNNAIDATFDNKYTLITAEMTADDDVIGDAKSVVGQGRAAQYNKTLGQDETFSQYSIRDKNESVAVNERNGEMSIENLQYQRVSSKILAEGLKTAFFNNEFKIEFDEASNSFTITQDGVQSITIVIDENGKFSDFEMNPENSAFTNMHVTYHVEGIDKQRFETEYKQIKDKVDELIEQYNSSLGA